MLAGYGILLAVVAALIVLPSARPLEDSTCDPSTSLAPNSSFPANLNLLAAALPANASSAPSGFGALSAGTASRAYAMALCRGDANASSCAGCVAAAFRAAGESCPNNTGATLYEDGCVLRYGNRQFLDFLKAQQWQVGELRYRPGNSTLCSIFSRVLFRPVTNDEPFLQISSYLTRTADDIVPAVAVERFGAAATAILAAVSDRALAAALSNSTTPKKYFATGEVAFDPRIYAMAQCVPVMTPAQCSGCLGQLIAAIKTMLSLTKPIWVTSRVEWCDLRYSVLPFYEGQSMLQLEAPPETTGAEKKKKKTSAAVGISVGVVCSLVLISILSVLVFIRFRGRTKTKATEHDNPFKKISRAQCVIFDLPALEEATENFSQRNKLRWWRGTVATSRSRRASSATDDGSGWWCWAGPQPLLRLLQRHVSDDGTQRNSWACPAARGLSGAVVPGMVVVASSFVGGGRARCLWPWPLAARLGG